MTEYLYQLLLVDDERTVVDNLSVFIPWEEFGIDTVHKAYSAYEALDILSKHRIHIVITDIRMPGINGLELLEEIYRRWKKVKCILLSGYADFEYAKQAIQVRAVEYLLKPISNEDLIKTVQQTIDVLNKEWEDVVSLERAHKLLQESQPLLHQNLLNDLLRGKMFTDQDLAVKLNVVELPLSLEKPFTILLVRLEEGFKNYGDLTNPLLEFAICNIADEVFGDSFDWCYCRDVHEYLIFFIVNKSGVIDESASPELLVSVATQLQQGVTSYLKGKMSIVVGEWGIFPRDITTMYQNSLSSLRRRVGNENDIFLKVEDQTKSDKFIVNKRLYEPPGLLHLLEAGKWNEAETKLAHIFSELGQMEVVLHEHILEVYFHIFNVFIYISHKNSKQLMDILQVDMTKSTGVESFQSINQLKSWVYSAFHKLKEDMNTEIKGNRAWVIQKVQDFIIEHLEKDLSLQLIAEHVHLHPVYLSKLYRAETGERLTDYLIRLRMEKAAYLLGDHRNKIQDIARRLGYHNTSYFIKVFKEYYQITPQEYRIQKQT